MRYAGGGVLARNGIEFCEEIRKAGFHGGIRIGKGDEKTLLKLWNLLENGALTLEPRTR